MKILRDVVCQPQFGISGLCDLFVPDRTPLPDVAVLSIHGGGWSSQRKESFEGVALWLCGELGFPVCNTNYRLIGEARWPACGDDCLAAARFLLDGSSSFFGGSGFRKIFVIGGSAGGHLALMTGLRLPPGRVAGVVSISGIADLESDRALEPGRYRALFGHEPEESEIEAASPASYLTPDSPPVLCTHDRKDNVVPIRSAQVFLEAVRKNGTAGESFYYEKPETGYSHRIWIPGSSPHKLYPELENAVSSFLAAHGGKAEK